MFLYILADLISFLEIQRLQLAGSSSTVFAVNLILYTNHCILSSQASNLCPVVAVMNSFLNCEIFLSYSVAPALGFFSGAVGPILIAIASNTVEADEQGMCL